MGKKLIMFPIYTLNNGVQIPAIGREFSAKMLIYYSKCCIWIKYDKNISKQIDELQLFFNYNN